MRAGKGYTLLLLGCVCGLQGGLWRLTGQQIAGAAAEGEGGASSSKGGAAGGGEGGGGDDVRGPHASLAVKLQVCLSLSYQSSCLCISQPATLLLHACKPSDIATCWQGTAFLISRQA